MFNDIAHRYDFLNRFLSAGIDIRWRKKAIRCLAGVKPGKILDVATGTADMAILAHQILGPVQITGIDISDGMLDYGRQKINKLALDKDIQLLNGDSEAIKFPDNSFDAVYAIEATVHAPTLAGIYSEIFRVLKPGGVFGVYVPVIIYKSPPQHLGDDRLID